MPYSNQQKKREYARQYQALKTKTYAVQIPLATGIPSAFEKAVRDNNISNNKYLIEAIREKLIRDGYMPESK